MGVAVGCCGVSRDDFEQMTPRELEAVVGAWGRSEQQRERQAWERMRLLATVTVQPHVRDRITPRTLIRLPWDSAEAEPDSDLGEQLTAAERRERAREFLRRLKDAYGGASVDQATEEEASTL